MVTRIQSVIAERNSLYRLRFGFVCRNNEGVRFGRVEDQATLAAC